MDDLISRQAAIDAILEQTVYATKRELVERCDANISVENGWLGGICIALDTIEDLPSAQQWILCSESLPEECENVLITDEDGYVVLADYARYSWEDDPIVWYSDGCHVKPVAWMPLPKPYKGERQ